MRRSLSRHETELKIGDVTLAPEKRLLKIGDSQLQLTPRENAILEFLMRNKNRPYSASLLLSAVWPSEADVTVDNVRVLVSNLRQKLARAGRTDFVKTVHNSGYVVEDAAS